MSMALYSLPDIHQTSWIEMRSDVTMRHEVDHDNGIVTLYFGYRNEYVISIGLNNLTQLLELGEAARRELVAAEPG